MSLRALTLSTRALREGSRSKAPVFVRGGLVLLLGLAAVAAYEMSQTSLLAGPVLLAWVTWTNWILISLLAIGSFSAVLTEEKELMTLGLLRLAGFTPTSLMLGKSVGLLLHTLLMIVVQVPFCMLAITLGGVGVDQVFGGFGLLLAYTLLVYAAALASSVVRARNSGAALLTFLFLLGYHLLPLLGLGVLSLIRNGRPDGVLAEWCMDWIHSTAFYGLVQATRGGFGQGFGSQITVNLVQAAVLFAVAWLAFDRCNRNEEPSAPARARSFGRRRDRQGELRSWANPFLWKDWRFGAGGLRTLVVRAVIYGAFFGVIGSVRRMTTSDFGTFVHWTSLGLLIVEVGLQLGRFLQDEVKAKTLGSLVAVPRSLAFVVWSKVLGSLALGLPALCYMVLGATLRPEMTAAWDWSALGRHWAPWAWLFSVVFGLHLTVYYSLVISRGALLLAIATIMLGNAVFFMGVLALDLWRWLDDHGTAVGILLTLVLAGASALLQLRIGARVRRLAAEE